MAEDYRMIPTTRRVYETIYGEHVSDLTVFATISHPKGNPFGNPNEAQMYTEWGFKDCDFPIMAIDQRWEVNHACPQQRNEYDVRYFLCVARSRD